MKLPSDETPDPTNGDGYLSDEYDSLEIMPAPIRDGDFSEYEWMEHEEEFNSQVLRELEEEELMEQCLVAMLDDEESQGNGTATTNNARNTNETSNSSSSMNGLSDSVTNMSLSANGVRSNPPSDDSSNSHSNSRSRFSVQDRLRMNRGPSNGNVSNVGEPKQESTLNPDAKEFVPLSLNTTTSTTTSENPNAPS